MIRDLGVLSLETGRQRGSWSPSFSTWELSFVRKTSLAPCEDRELDEEYWETISLLWIRLQEWNFPTVHTAACSVGSAPSLEILKPKSELRLSDMKKEVERSWEKKKIRMWQKYKKQVTDGGQKLQWPQRPFLEFLQPGPALTPHQRKVQMGKIPQAVVNALEHKSQGTLEAT